MKKLSIVISSFAAVAVAAVFLFSACQKSASSPSSSTTSGSKQNLSLYLTDGPGFFDSVFINIKSVSILLDTCAKDSSRRDYFNRNTDAACGDLVSLDLAAGEYNVLALRNGIDTLLASGTSLPAGKIKAIELVLGTDSINNYVVHNGVTHYLHFGNTDSATVVIPLRGDECEKYAVNKFRLWLDFDVARSIYFGWDGRYHLRPFFRFFTRSTTGTISGIALPHDAYPVVTAYNSTDTSYALPQRNGVFLISGLQPGTYTVNVAGAVANTYQDTTISNVTVTEAANTAVGTITLHK